MATILVVDHEKDDGEALRLLLADQGFEVERVANSREALDHGVWYQPDVLVVGDTLGRIRGPKVAEALRLVKPAMSLVLTTDFNSSDLAVEARKLEVTALLERPFEPEILSQAVEVAVARPAGGRSTCVAILGIRAGGEIELANPEARRLLAETEAGADVSRIQEVLGPDADRWLELAAEEWQQVEVRSQSTPTWQIRTRFAPGAPGYLAVLLEGEQFLAQLDDGGRYFSDQNLVRLLLDLPTEQHSRWPYGSESRILLIDGSHAFRHLAAAEIDRIDVGWLSAGNLDEALRLLELESRIRLVLLDDQAVDVGLIQRLRSGCCGEIEIVGVSLDDHREAFAALGVHRFLRKPWPVESLIEALEA